VPTHVLYIASGDVSILMMIKFEPSATVEGFSTSNKKYSGHWSFRDIDSHENSDCLLLAQLAGVPQPEVPAKILFVVVPVLKTARLMFVRISECRPSCHAPHGLVPSSSCKTPYDRPLSSDRMAQFSLRSGCSQTRPPVIRQCSHLLVREIQRGIVVGRKTGKA